MPESILLWVAIVVTGFMVGFINTLAGSGSLLSLPLLIFLGLDPVTANGTNRIAIMLQNVVGVSSFHQQKMIDWKFDLHFAIPALVGAILGAQIAVDLNQDVMQNVIGAVLLLMLVVMILKPKRFLENREVKSSWIKYPIFFLIGVYGGFIQAGVGIFILMGLSLTAGLNLVRANAVKVLIVLIYTPLALVIFIYNGHVNWLYGLVMAAGNMVGAFIASRMAVKHGASFIKIILYIIIPLSAVALFLGKENISTWFQELFSKILA